MRHHDFASAKSPAVDACYAYWRSKRSGDRIPGRQHIDPGEMRHFLRYVILFDVEGNAPEYRFRQRLVGTHIVDLFGRDTTGEYIHETSAPDHYLPAQKRLVEVVQTLRPSYGVHFPPTPHKQFVKYEHLTLPLAADGQRVDMLFGVRCGLEGERRGG